MLSDIINSIAQPALIFKNTQVLASNSAMQNLLGYSESIISEASLLKLIHTSSRRASIEFYNNLVDAESYDDAITIRLCPANEKPCWGSLQIRPAPYAGENCYLAIVQDVTKGIITPQIHYQSMIEQVPIGMYRILVDGTIAYANEALAHLLGCESVAELKRHSIKEFYANPDERTNLVAGYAEADDETFENELLWRRLDGREIWIHSTGQLFRDTHGNLLYFQGTIEDYTEKKQQALQIQQHNQERETLHRITQSLSTSLKVNETLDILLEQVQQIIPYTSSSIFLLQDGKLELLADKNLPEDAKGDIVLATPEFENIAQLSQLDTPDVQVMSDVRTYSAWYPIEQMAYIRSWMGVALRYKDEIIGILNFDHTEIDFYTEHHMQHAMTVASHAAIAIANSQLYEKAMLENDRRQSAQDVLVQNLIYTETLYWVLQNIFEAKELENVLQHVLNMMCAALDDTSLILITFDSDTREVQHQYQTSNSDLDIWETFETIIDNPTLETGKMPNRELNWQAGRTYQLPDGRQGFAATIRHRGVLAAIRRTPDSPQYNEANVELLITIANQLSIALENEDKAQQLETKSDALALIAKYKTNQLELEQKRQQAILDATAEGIFYMENFRIQYANPAFCQMVGYTLEELYGRPLSHIRVKSDTPKKPNFDDLLEDSTEVEAGRSETRLRHKDGTEFYASIRFSMIGQPGSDMLRMVAVARDISQERELYFQRARFIANAAHELRTPLSSLMLRMHLLKRQPEKSDTHIDSLDKATNHLKYLVEELLDLSRFERGTIALNRDQYELQALVKQASDTSSMFAQEQNVTIDLQLPTSPLVVKVDGKRIIQLLENLIVNGINYNKAGGKVTVTLATDEDFVGNRNIIIEVTDDGLGIPQALLPTQIFEPFVRPSEGSRRETGMGLALCREIVQLHQGKIYARSEKDNGSTFRIILPAD